MKSSSAKTDSGTPDLATLIRNGDLEGIKELLTSKTTEESQKLETSQKSSRSFLEIFRSSKATPAKTEESKLSPELAVLNATPEFLKTLEAENLVTINQENIGQLANKIVQCLNQQDTDFNQEQSKNRLNVLKNLLSTDYVLLEQPKQLHKELKPIFENNLFFADLASYLSGNTDLLYTLHYDGTITNQNPGEIEKLRDKTSTIWKNLVQDYGFNQDIAKEKFGITEQNITIVNPRMSNTHKSASGKNIRLVIFDQNVVEIYNKNKLQKQDNGSKEKSQENNAVVGFDEKLPPPSTKTNSASNLNNSEGKSSPLQNV